ncbi:MAG: AcrB/AcrD/AcrF family protein, partial [Sulfurimonas sp.]
MASEHDISNVPVSDYAGHLAKIFLYNPLTPILAIFLLSIGYLSLVIMPREEDPQIAISGGTIIVPLPGATPQEIDNIIVKPLERKLREIAGIKHIYGVATDNVGMVNVMYKIGENREDSNLKLYDKVMQNMELLPKGAMEPLIKPFDIDIDVPIVSIAFYLKEHSTLSNVELFKKIRDIQQDFNEVDNVSKTTLKGEHKEQFNVKVDLFKLSGYHLSLGQIKKALQSLAVNVPDVKSNVKDGGIMIFGIKNAIESVKDVQNVIVASYMGSPIYLKDIATVEKSYDIQNYKSAQITYRQGDTLSPIRDQITINISKL